MLTCVVIDDEERGARLIEGYVERTSELELLGTFLDPEEALDFISKNEPDLIFLDINMPEISGLSFVELMAVKPFIVFTTAYSEYAVESYEKNAVDYLLKPISYERFLKAISKVKSLERPIHARSPIDETVLLKEKANKIHLIRKEDILYTEKAGNYMKFRTIDDQSIMVRMNMEVALDALGDRLFCRVHRSFIISLKHLETIEPHQLTIKGLQVPIGPKFRDLLFDRVREYRS